MQAAPSMPQQDPLAQLKDIHPPAAVDWWPLDWGWWLLIALFIGALVGVAIYVRRRKAFNRPRKEARVLLTQIKETDENWPMQVNEVLKRTALCYFPHEEVAKLYGNGWKAFMLRHVSNKYHNEYIDGLDALHAQLYAPVKDKSQFSACIEAADKWLLYGEFKPSSSSQPTKVVAKEASHA